MARQVILAASAARGLKKLDKSHTARLLAAVRALAEDPHPPGARKLSGHPFLRLRVGDYRVIYQVTDDDQTLVVLKVGHRREVYERLDELRLER